MKKALLLIIVSLFVNATAFASYAIDFNGFKAWMNKVKFPGYRVMEIVEDDSEYTAMFTKGSDYIQVRLGAMDKCAGNFPGKEETYTRNGLNLRYLKTDFISGLSIEAKNLNACVFIGAQSISKAELEKLADILNVGAVVASQSSKKSLPSDIPADEGLSGDLISVEKIEPATTDGYAFEYKVKYRKNKELVASLKALLKKWNASIDLCQMKDFTFLCSAADSMQGFEELKAGSEVDFTYYKHLK